MDLVVRKLLHNLKALADLGEEVSSTHHFEEVMRASLFTLLGAVAVPRGAIARFTSRPPQLKLIADKGFDKAGDRRIRLERGELERLKSRSRPIEMRGLRLPASTAVPMVVHGELVGVVFLGKKLSGDRFSEQDLRTINTIARHIGIAIFNHRLMVSLKRKADENRRLYREMREMHQNTIRAFAAAIDLKDAYTKGHSDRVARYAEAIGREMGVSGAALDQIRTAGYLHDIGKIIVDRSIINNPRPLTEHEYRELNKHVTTGYEILSNISRPWKEIAYMTKCHHEKVDGTGYPHGLRGEEIPLGAKIVTVADSYDAMITDRPYRSRLPLDQALTELKRHTGRQFAPEVVSAFCKALLKEVRREVRERVLTSAVAERYDREALAGILTSMIAHIEESFSQ
jgi:putative nucleotidyltransferase with HDIG domain